MNDLTRQTKKLIEHWRTLKDLSPEQCLDLQLAIGRLNEQICVLTVELGEMRTRTYGR